MVKVMGLRNDSKNRHLAYDLGHPKPAVGDAIVREDVRAGVGNRSNAEPDKDWSTEHDQDG